MKAWCWFFATIFKPRNVKCNIFSELTQNASLLFFRKKINENVTEKFCLKLKSEPNFAEKLCVENTLRETKFDKPSWREILKPKTKLYGKNFVLIFKFKK